MTTLASRATIPTVLLGAILAFGTGCASSPPPPDEPVASESSASSPSAAATAGGEASTATGEDFGCSDGMLAYMAENGYPGATPQDPASFTFPEGVSISAVPVCYVVDDAGGVERSGAIFQGDTAAVVAEIGGALTGAGYMQSDDFGPYIWWVGGDEPVGAEHAVGAAPQPIDGVDSVWATW